MEVYIDDMLVKSKKKEDHLSDLSSTFETLRKYRMKLNARKCSFGVQSGKFIGYLVSKRGIKANPDQIDAINRVQPPHTIRDMQKLTGMLAALNRFISRSFEKCKPFFQLLKRSKSIEWNPDCSRALDELKSYLNTPPLLVIPQQKDSLYLYLSVSNYTVSSALICEVAGIQHLVYYASKTLLDAEKRYLPLEKLAFALLIASRKLKHYFEAHTIIVLTSHPLKAVLRKADFLGRLSKWSVELERFDIQFQPRTAIKGQILADFINEFTGEELSDQPHPTKQNNQATVEN